MIRYNPPKSQVWGHQVGRLSATAVVDRCWQFLNDQCTIINSQPSELMIGWNSEQHGLVSEVASEVDRNLGQPTTVNELPRAGGQVFRQRRWPFPADKLAAVAKWFDRLAESLKTDQVVAHSSTFWIFAWHDEPPPLRPIESAGGMLGIHLGRPHRITTAFSFRDFDEYSRIKAYLSGLELVELSDRHLRPKTGAVTAKRRAK